MKLTSMKSVSFALAVTCATILFSCQKDGSESNETNLTTPAVTEDEAVTYSDESVQAEGSFDDIEDIGRLAADEEASASAVPGGRIFPFVQLRLRLGPCAQISVSPNDSTYPKTVTISFPGDGCWCADGKHRKGTITLNFTGPVHHPGSVLTIALTDFYLNRAHVEGTKVISNLSSNGFAKFTVQVTGGKVTFPNGRGYSYEATKSVTQTAGDRSASPMDDVFSIEGHSQTTRNNGIVITLDTGLPLIKKVACNWISEGTLRIKINQRTLNLDYGAPNSGDCDNKALLTWNNGNNQRLVSLP